MEIIQFSFLSLKDSVKLKKYINTFRQRQHKHDIGEGGGGPVRRQRQARRVAPEGGDVAARPQQRGRHVQRRRAAPARARARAARRQVTCTACHTLLNAVVALQSKHVLISILT